MSARAQTIEWLNARVDELEVENAGLRAKLATATTALRAIYPRPESLLGSGMRLLAPADQLVATAQTALEAIGETP